MNPQQLLIPFTTGDISGMLTAVSAIIADSQNPSKVLPLIPYRSLIAEKTTGLEMGGLFAPNKRFVDYALKILDFHAKGGACPCALYSDFGYECNDPNREADKNNISIDNIVKIENAWVDYYLCSCLRCGQKFKVLEREGHYMWWAWIKTEA